MLGHRPLTLADYVGILKRRWVLIAVPLMLVPIVSVAVSYTISPQYLSQTLVLVESQKVPEGLVKPVISADLDSRLASMKEQILSRSSLQPIIDRNNLYADKKLSMDDRIDRARKSIQIKTITSEIAHGSGLPGFFISFQAGDPHTAQQICSDITSLFINENLRSRSDSAEGTVDFLQSQLAGAKRNLDEQDAKLAAFQEQHVGRLPGEEATNGNMLASLNTQLEASTQALARMQQDKAFSESMLSQQLANQTPIPTTTVGATSATTDELQSLLTRRAELLGHYTADYPDVVALDHRIEDARRQAARPVQTARSSATLPSRADSPAVQQLRAQIQSANIGIEAKRKEQAQLQSSIGNYQSRVMSSPAVAQQYKQLTRDYQTAQQFYDDLLSKINASKMATDLEKRQQGEQFRLMDAANLPDSPVSPKRSVFFIGGLAGGLLVGIVVLAFLEFKDTSLRNERDILAFMALPTLTMIGVVEGIPQPHTRNWFTKIFFRRVPRTSVPVALRD